MIKTIQRLEDGVKIQMPKAEKFDSVSINGDRYYRMLVSNTSEFEKLRNRISDKKGFSWELFLDRSQNMFRGSVRFACYFSEVSELPTKQKYVAASLKAFSGSSKPAVVELYCR